jgi:hypothetical protein
MAYLDSFGEVVTPDRSLLGTPGGDAALVMAATDGSVLVVVALVVVVAPRHLFSLSFD